MELNLGILGFGGMGYWHAHNAVRVEGVNIIGSYDINPNAYFDSPEIKVYESEDALFSDPAINTILLTVPNHLHKEYAIKAARAGKNIICEKPAALSVADFDEMVETAKDCDVLFTVHQNRRWDNDFCTIKKVYDNALIGNIYNIESTLHSPSGRTHNWHQFKEYGGGIVWDWGVHMLDQALQLIPKKVDHVYAELKSIMTTEVEDFYRIHIRFEDGESYHICQAPFCLKAAPRWFICGDKGTAVVNSFAGDGNYFTTSEQVVKLPPRIEDNPAGPTRSFAPIPPGKLLTHEFPEVMPDWCDFYKNYIDVMNGKAEFIVRNEQVRRVLALIDTVYKSAEAGESQPFDYDKVHELVISTSNC